MVVMAKASRAVALALALVAATFGASCGDDDPSDTGSDTGDPPDLPDTDFEIELVYQSDATASQREAFESARLRWLAVIQNSQGSAQIDLASPQAIDACESSGEGGTITTNGVAIIVKLDPIDGRGGTLGAAGPCFVRQATGAPVLGIMTFDSADLDVLEATNRLETVILHEMGHVIGFGTLWGLEELLANPSLPNNAGADTHFTGAGAQAAFDEASSGNFSGSIVPVDNSAQPGSADGHWREDVLDTELMTSSITGTEASVPMSAITIASLGDFPFYDVNEDVADPYTVPQLFAPRAPTPSAATSDRTPPHDLVRPRFAVDAEGNVRALAR